MRNFLAGVGGQYVLRRRQKKLSDWERAWTGGKAEAKVKGKEEEATEALSEYLEYKFNKTKTETAPLLDNIPLEEIRALRRFAYACDNYESFVRRVKEAKRYC